MSFAARFTPVPSTSDPAPPPLGGPAVRPSARIEMSGDPLIPGAHPYGRRADDLPEHQQRALDRRVAAVVERMSDAFLALGPDWPVTYANAEAARLNGTTPAALVGRDHWAAWPETVGSEVERQYRHAVAERVAVVFEHHYEKAGVWHDIRAYPADDGGLAVFYRDITHQKRQDIEREHLLAEARLAYAEADRERAAAEQARVEAEAANAAKAQFLATMSHELRTPLNAIAGHVQLLDMELHGPLTDAQREALQRVERAQRHLLGLITDILSFARLESGRVEYDVQPTLVRDVLGDVLPLVEPQAAAKGLVLERRMPEDAGAAPVRLLADRDKLAQVLLNLLSNAVKFTPAGGRVTVELAPPAGGGDLAELRVVDTGIGIPADRLEAVFERFFQVAKGYAREAGGTGLGLAISRDLARGMGGDLTVESAPGAGSTFTLTLPRG